MRFLIASMAVLAAVAFAAPSFAQDDPAAAPAPVPTTKPKPGTTAYCQQLKSTTSRSACMKKLHAQVTPKAVPTTKKAKKTTTPAKQPDVGQLTPPPTAAAAPPPAPTGGTVAVPPLPQKTI